MSDEAAIKEVIQTYFECMYESDEGKTYQAFHPAAMITGYEGGQLMELNVETFAKFVSSQPSARDNGEEAILEIISLDINGETAVATVRDAYLNNLYLDTLSFLRVDGQWKIYNKLFHIEKKLNEVAS